MLVTSQQIMSNRTWNRWTSSFDIVARTVLLDIQLNKVFIETKATIDLVCQKSQSGTLLADDLPGIPAGNDDGQLVFVNSNHIANATLRTRSHSSRGSSVLHAQGAEVFFQFLLRNSKVKTEGEGMVMQNSKMIQVLVEGG